ncbi:ribosome maturation factor rimM [Candidatus Blochmanniella vafra str. BVAF]|uniref:Ribosome maturation factor RimM n=1 Tax=Blochmanniella vafra (strain BVAF) TaxID=859654 RepID=E8Q5T3_BLOVB|nr:ribosome maturation factor RimM [Candidatus Blochmannia vafer]ADV33580.1 ribosome maturation factor rimM [Candidatus Blochmannia vafer str. BVAF]
MDFFLENTEPLDPVIIGKIGGAYGVQGWLKIISFTDKIEDIFKYCPWFILLRSQWKLMILENWRVINKHYIAKISDISSREIAMSLAQCNLIIDSKSLPILKKEGEYYWKDIIGCEVINIDGDYLGYVINIIETQAHDVLVIKLNSHDDVKIKSCLIPFVQKKIIKYVSIINRTIIVDWGIYDRSRDKK